MGGASQKATMLESCLQAYQSIISSVRDWSLPMEWVSSWADYWLDALSVSVPSLDAAFLIDRINVGLKVLWVV